MIIFDGTGSIVAQNATPRAFIMHPMSIKFTQTPNNMQRFHVRQVCVLYCSTKTKHKQKQKQKHKQKHKQKQKQKQNKNTHTTNRAFFPAKAKAKVKVEVKAKVEAQGRQT